MSTKILNKGPFLKEQRLFPQDAQPLSVEIDRAYVDIASKSNDKTIGFFPTNGSAITGEKWSVNGIIYSGFRQVYTFTAAGNITHNITTSSIVSFTRIYGVFTNGTNWYPLPYVDVAAANNQVNVIVTPTVITIAVGGGAPPAITGGYVVLEYISQS